MHIDVKLERKKKRKKKKQIQSHEERISGLEISNNELRISNNELKTSNIELKISDNELRISNNDLKSQIAKLTRHVSMHDEARLRLFRANILVDLVKKVSIDLKLDPPDKTDQTKDNTKRRRITQVARSIKQQQLEFFFKEDGKKYGPQYFKLRQKIDQVRDSKCHLIFKYYSR